MTKEERLAAEQERLKAMYETQRELTGDTRFVFGIDEAGRGPLCGPVAAACCILPEDAGILYLNDSKKISEKKRELLYDEITEKALAYGVAFVGPERIDEINILNATMEAMADAFEKAMNQYRENLIKKLDSQTGDGQHLPNDEPLSMDHLDGIPSFSDSLVLVDGNRTSPGIHFRQKAVIGGDAKCPCISAASILAKVSRDRLLIEYDRQYPEYGFAKHKGYGTKEHIEAIRKYGVLDIHRRSFLKKLI